MNIGCSESAVAVHANRGEFKGVDLVHANGIGPVVVAAENASHCLVAYTEVELPSFLEASERSFGLRRAGILTWPTPSPEAVSQVLQQSFDLSNPLAWENIESRNVRFEGSESGRETLIDMDGSSAFYRIQEFSE